MNLFYEEMLALLLEKGWQEIVPILMIAGLRPLGLLYGFTGFTWTLSTNRLLRVVLAISIGAPVALINLPVIIELIESPVIFILAITALTEIAIGFGFGFIASLPFFALTLAGAVTDQFRGENDSGIQSPLGGAITTYGLLYTIIALFAFALGDGIGLLISTLYRSYTIWPISELLPVITYDTVTQTLQVFGAATLLGVRLLTPLFIILLIVEIIVIFGARVGKRFNFYNFAFPLKNIAALVTLPVIASYAWLFSNEIINDLYQTYDLFRTFPK